MARQPRPIRPSDGLPQQQWWVLHLRDKRRKRNLGSNTIEWDEPNNLGSYGVGTIYSHQFQAFGGEGPLTYSLESGTLPTGFTISDEGVLAGTVHLSDSGSSFTFVVRVTDGTNYRLRSFFFFA